MLFGGILFFNKFIYILHNLKLIIETYIDWGLGIGDWGLGPIPNPQSPIPNPQSPLNLQNIHKIKIKILK